MGFISGIQKIFGLIIIAFAHYTAYEAAEGLVVIADGNIFQLDKFYFYCMHALTYVLVLFVFSFFYNNLSFMDFQWTIYPLIQVIQTLNQVRSRHKMQKDLNLKFILPLIIFLFWAIRLTLQCAREFKGFHHQDFRYCYYEKKAKFRLIYWIFALLMFFALPLAITIYTIYPFILYLKREDFQNDYTITNLQFIGLSIMLFSQYIQSQSDLQLHEFRTTNTDKSKCINTGFWKFCRHPNYFGEMLFWWGLYIYCAQTTGFQYPIGAFSLSLLIILGSGPMMEKRLLQTKGDNYRFYKNKVISAYIPFISIG